MVRGAPLSTVAAQHYRCIASVSGGLVRLCEAVGSVQKAQAFKSHG